MSSACELVVFNLDSEATQECWSWLIKQLRHIASTKWKSVDVKWLSHFRSLPLSSYLSFYQRKYMEGHDRY
jgi:hypothetical protein